MTVRAVVIARNLQLPAAAAAQFTGPVNTTTVIKRAVFTNTSAGIRAVTAHVVPSGGAVGNSTMLINGQSLAAPPGAAPATWRPSSRASCFSPEIVCSALRMRPLG